MENPTDITTEATKKKGSKKREYLISVVSLTITVALCVAVVVYWDFINQAQQFGYLGVFIISIFAGGTIVVPVPGLLVVFTMGSVLQPAIVGAAAGIGEAIGSITIYLTGHGGHSALKTINHGFTDRLERLIRRRGSIAVFLMSAIINPLFYPFTAVAGMLRFGLVRFFLLCWAGKTIKGMFIAYVGYFGLGSLLRWIGVVI